MGCVLCNLITLLEEKKPFRNQKSREAFMEELARDISSLHTDLVEKINDLWEHKLRDSMYEWLLSRGHIDGSIPKEDSAPKGLWEIAKGIIETHKVEP